MKLEITTKIENEYILFSVQSTLSIENITPLKTLLSKYVDEKKHILIDLSGITFIDSSALGILVLSNAKLEKNNKRLLLINLSNDMMRMFKSTKLDNHILIFDDVKSAIESLGIN